MALDKEYHPECFICKVSHNNFDRSTAPPKSSIWFYILDQKGLSIDPGSTLLLRSGQSAILLWALPQQDMYGLSESKAWEDFSFQKGRAESQFHHHTPFHDTHRLLPSPQIQCLLRSSYERILCVHACFMALFYMTIGCPTFTRKSSYSIFVYTQRILMVSHRSFLCDSLCEWIHTENLFCFLWMRNFSPGRNLQRISHTHTHIQTLLCVW